MFRSNLLPERSEPREGDTVISLSEAAVEQARASISRDVEYPRPRER